MAKVRIVYVPDAERRGPDLDRIGRVEEVADDLARVMVGFGEATYVADDEPEPDPATAASTAESRPGTVLKPAKQGSGAEPTPTPDAAQ
jgi:hypothetical protein